MSVLEGLHLKHHSEYKEFSEQAMLDCTYEESGDNGCKGGKRRVFLFSSDMRLVLEGFLVVVQCLSALKGDSIEAMGLL